MWMLLTWFRCVTAVWLAFWTWLLRKITFEGRWRISWTNWLTWEWLDSEWMPVSTCGLAIWTTFTAVSTTWIPNGSPAAADPLSSRRWGLVFCFFLCRTIFLLDVNPFFFFFASEKVIDLGGEPITTGEYVGLGRVTEFKYGARLGELFRKWNGQKLSYTKWVCYCC